MLFCEILQKDMFIHSSVQTHSFMCIFLCVVQMPPRIGQESGRRSRYVFPANVQLMFPHFRGGLEKVLVVKAFGQRNPPPEGAWLGIGHLIWCYPCCLQFLAA